MAILPQNMAFNMAQRELAGCISYCLQTLNLPTFIVEQILNGYQKDLALQAEQEYIQAKAQYEQEIEEERKRAFADKEDKIEEIKSEN